MFVNISDGIFIGVEGLEYNKIILLSVDRRLDDIGMIGQGSHKLELNCYAEQDYWFSPLMEIN